MWDLSQKGGKSSGKTSIIEGNIEIHMFSGNRAKVVFLTEDIDVEELMAAKTLTREKVVEFINTELMYDKWIQPFAFWEHTVPSIPQKRFFTTLPCQGMDSCTCCMHNSKAKENGIDENKYLPFPVRKRYVVPAYFIDLDKILFVKQDESFFQDIANSIGKFGASSVFEIWKEGKGYNTTYKSSYDGAYKGEKLPVPEMKPKEIDFTLSPEEMDKRCKFSLVGGSGVSSTPKEESTEFVIPFGNFKGQTLDEIHKINPEYITFLKENSSGLVQTKVIDFLAKMGK